MTQPEAFARIIKILQLPPFDLQNTDQFTEATLLPTFLDSLEIIELAIILENELGSTITDYTVENWNTIGDIATTYRNIKDE